MLEIRLFHPGDPQVRQGGAELLDVWAEDPEARVWVDVDGELSAADRQTLEARFGLHLLALQDASRDRHPPKLEIFEDHSFLLFKGLSAESDNIDCGTIQMAIFVAERFLVTRHSGHSPSVVRLANDLQAGKLTTAESPGRLALRLTGMIVQRYLRILLALEPRLEELEEEILSSGDDAELAELIGYKSDLTRLRRFFHYHVDLIDDLRRTRAPGFEEALGHEINDLYELQERVASLTELYYQLASDLIDGYISVSSHRLNQIMRVLTIITAIFVPLSFLAGVYGMNFEYMPELKSHWGYFTLLGTMGSLATIMLFVFRRKRWL